MVLHIPPKNTGPVTPNTPPRRRSAARIFPPITLNPMEILWKEPKTGLIEANGTFEVFEWMSWNHTGGVTKLHHQRRLSYQHFITHITLLHISERLCYQHLMNIVPNAPLEISLLRKRDVFRTYFTRIHKLLYIYIWIKRCVLLLEKFSCDKWSILYNN